MMDERYDRNIRLFGEEGQDKISATTVAVFGAGGLGSALIQHLALLGVKKIISVDHDGLDDTNRNRLVGAMDDDPAGKPKVEIADRLIRAINSKVASEPLPVKLISEEGFAAALAADWAFGCFDHDGPRAVLNELCAAYTKPYVDLASDVRASGAYGGRVCVSVGNGCLHCYKQLASEEVRRYLASEEQLRVEDKIYGVDAALLGEKGPAVSPINGVVAGLAATEFMVAVTGMRKPRGLQTYRGHQSIVTVTPLEVTSCPFCHSIRGSRHVADVERYLRLPYLRER